MGKAFSPFTMGVGLTTALALVPGLGLVTKPAPAPRASQGGPAAQKKEETPKPGQALEALLDQCRETAEGEKGGASPSAVDVTLLTLPDPQRTHMAFWFDLRLNAVQAAFKERGYLPRAFFLPWAFKAKETGKEGVSSAYAEEIPGLVWFAREGKADLDGPRFHALFIVGESQALGLNRVAFKRALDLAVNLGGQASSPPSRRPICILGPQYSGSRSSLGAALQAHFEANPNRPIRIQGTTTLDEAAAEDLRQKAGGPSKAKLQISTWSCNLSLPFKESLRNWFWGQVGWPRKVAIFMESNTAYGSAPPPSGAPGKVADAVAPTRIYFPMGLSRLRAERRAMEHDLAKGGGKPEVVLPSTLLAPAEDEAQEVLDTLPQYSGDTVRNTEMTLAGTILSLSRRGYTHIGISASDPQDLIFLAERIRAYHPTSTLFSTSGNHLLYAHPNFSTAMDGMILLGGYPLTDSMRALSLQKGELESPVRFTSEGEYAVYYAALLSLATPREQAPDSGIWKGDPDWKLRGKQGFVSVVKGGSIWPLRHGGKLEGLDSQWNHAVDPDFLDTARESKDLREYIQSRLRQLSVLLILIVGVSYGAFLHPLLELGGASLQRPDLKPYRALGAGALLALALASLLAAGYLLPLFRLGMSGKDPFMGVNLLAWGGFLVATERALERRWSLGRRLPSLLLALLPALGLGGWAWTRFLEFMPLYLRFSSPGRGVSLMPTLLLLSAALALQVRACFDVGRQKQAAFWPRPFGLSIPHTLSPTHSMKGWLLVGGVLIAGLVASQYWITGGVLRSLMEVPVVTAVLVGGGGAVLLTACFLFRQLFLGGKLLAGVLDDLNYSPYRAAFAEAGKLMHWNAMEALGRGLRSHRSSLRGREILEAQKDWILKLDPSYAAQVEALRETDEVAPRGRKAMTDLARWRLRGRVASLMCSCGEALHAATKANPKEAEARQGDLHLFFALRAVTYIRQAYLVARHLLLGSLGSLILLLLAVAAFDFQPKAAVLMLLGGALLGMAAWVTLSLIHMERDPLLCLMQEGAIPGQVQFSMALLENGVRYVLVPLLMLVATLNPSWGASLVQAFNPLMHFLK